MRRWWVLAALLLSVGLNCGLLGAWLARRGLPAGPDRPPLGGPPRGAVLELIDRLELTAEQRERFLERHRRFFESTQADRQAMEAARRELRREVARPQPDRARLEALLDEAGRRNAALERAFVDHVLATRELLTPEQQARYLALLSRLRPPREVGATGQAGRGSLRDRWLRRQSSRPSGERPAPTADPAAAPRP